MTTWTKITKATGTAWTKVASMVQTIPDGTPIGLLLALTYTGAQQESTTAWTKITKATGTAWTKITKAV